MTKEQPKITLRPFTRAEYHEFYQDYEADPIMDPNRYEYNATHVDKCFDYDQTRRDWYPVFGIFDEEGTPVGSLSIKRIDREASRCEIGIILQSDAYKNQGYGTEAMRQAIRYAAEDLGLRLIYADTMGSNARMQHILDKLGFRLIERIPRVYDMGGRMEDKLDYVLEVRE